MLCNIMQQEVGEENRKPPQGNKHSKKYPLIFLCSGYSLEVGCLVWVKELAGHFIIIP